MIRFPVLLALLIAATASLVGAARAQLDLQGAAPAAAAAKPAQEKKAKSTKAAKPSAGPATPRIAIHPPGVDTVLEKDLLHNGGDGVLRLGGDAASKSLKVEKFTLPGEVISDPKQKCRIDIVAQTPIEATSQGDDDGVERFSADIPACPLSFDVLDGAVEVPPQTTACVFQAADCQASPSGVWGPDGSAMEKLAKVLTRERSIADASIASNLKYLAKHDKSAAAKLADEEADFAARRDDVCHDYVAESRHGFCATRLTEARAALLTKRASLTTPEEPKKRKKHDASANN